MSLETNSGTKVIKLGVPGGFCPGVERSVDAYRGFVESHQGRVIYSVGKPAHNPHVNQEFIDKGVKFVDSIDQVPPTADVIFGPHGHTAEDVAKACLEIPVLLDELNFQAVGRDSMLTECPRVTNVKDRIAENTLDGYTTLYWGQVDKNGELHAETRAALSSGKAILVTSLMHALSQDVAAQIDDFDKVAFDTQTTHNADDALEIEEKLKERYPKLRTRSVSDICFATRNRQQVAKTIDTQVVIVIGDVSTSSNTRSLIKTVNERGIQTIAVNDISELNQEVFRDIESVGVVPSASAPKKQVDEVVDLFTSSGWVFEEFRIYDKKGRVIDESKAHFPLPETQSSFRPQFVWSDPERF